MIFLFTFIYMISYLTRNNYATVISEIIIKQGITKSLASLALTASAITYGFGQLLSGYLCDRIQPKKLIALGLITTFSMNIMLPLFNNPHIYTLLWAVNGMAQAFMWPPMVKLMVSIFDDKLYTDACIYISMGSSMGSILIYLIAPLIIKLLNWQSVFFISSFIALIGIVAWLRFSPKIDLNNNPLEKKEEKKQKNAKFVSVTFVGIIILIVIQGALRDGVTSWTPTYISEQFKTNNLLSIFLGSFLPIFGMISYKLTSLFNRKVIKNIVLCSGTIFILSSVCAVLLVILRSLGVFFSVFLMSLLVGCMYGINLLLIAIVPKYYQYTGKVGTISGILNSATYIGSAVSTYSIAVISESFGWNFTIFMWALLGLFAFFITLAIFKSWGKIQKD